MTESITVLYITMCKDGPLFAHSFMQHVHHVKMVLVKPLQSTYGHIRHANYSRMLSFSMLDSNGIAKMTTFDLSFC